MPSDDHNIPCSHCHYDLRVHQPSENCPECGSPVEASLIPSPCYALMDLPWLKKMYRGTFMLFIAMGGFLLYFLMTVLWESTRTFAEWGTFFEKCHNYFGFLIIIFSFGLAVLIIFSYGIAVVLLTRPDPKTDHLKHHKLQRRIAIAAAIVLLADVLFIWMNAMFPFQYNMWLMERIPHWVTSKIWSFASEFCQLFLIFFGLVITARYMVARCEFLFLRLAGKSDGFCFRFMPRFIGIIGLVWCFYIMMNLLVAYYYSFTVIPGHLDITIWVFVIILICAAFCIFWLSLLWWRLRWFLREYHWKMEMEMEIKIP